MADLKKLESNVEEWLEHLRERAEQIGERLGQISEQPDSKKYDLKNAFKIFMLKTELDMCVKAISILEKETDTEEQRIENIGEAMAVIVSNPFLVMDDEIEADKKKNIDEIEKAFIQGWFLGSMFGVDKGIRSVVKPKSKS